MKPFTSERAAERWFVDLCREHGAFVQKLQANFTVGLPDLIVVHRGCVAFYELKLADREPTLLQWRTIRLLREAGASAYVLHIYARDNLRLRHAADDRGRHVRPDHPMLDRCLDLRSAA